MATSGRIGSWSPFRCRGGGDGEDCTGGVDLALLLVGEVLDNRTLTAVCLGRGARNVENDLGPVASKVACRRRWKVDRGGKLSLIIPHCL